METLDPGQQFFGGVGLFPDARDVFISFRQGRVDVNRAEDFIQAEAVAHRQHIFRQQIASVFTIS